ncbi:hypothetical protein [Caballeronia sordidicola]|uniref:hypothetical protein n=1 Tax=Caballeronia sordidicola TaxID=196367 RepID=UPI0004CFEDD3|nr:hypothetical protein [Caballeronia sordidicola]
MSVSNRHITKATKDASRTQRPAKSSTEKGMKYTGKHAGEVAAFMGDAKRVCSDLVFAADAHSKITKAKDAGLEFDPSIVELAEQVLCNAMIAATAILNSGTSLLASVNQDIAAGQPDEEGVVETGTGEVPREYGAMDAGRSVVLDHIAAVSGEPGSETRRPHVMDGLRVEALRQHAGRVLGAINPARVLAGMDDEPLTDYSQLSFMRDRANK